MGKWLAFFILLMGCSLNKPVSNNKPCVVSTIAQIEHLVKEIGGDRIVSQVLVRGEINPHSYELVKGDNEKVSRADLLLYNGLGLEHGASVVGLIQTHPNALGVADTLHPDKILWKGKIPDPHVWMDVALWAETVDPITEKLVALDQAGAGEFRANAVALKVKMLAVHKEMLDMMQAVPEEKRYLITSHDAFHYFVRSYLASPGETHWEKRFAAPEGLAPDGQLNPSDLQRIIQQMETHHIEVLFPESSVNRDSIRKLASAGKELGLVVRICEKPLYGDTFKGTYLDAMKHNATTIAQGLHDPSR